jgi:hypothetical protein
MPSTRLALPHAREPHRGARHLLHAEGSAPAGVTVELCQDDAREAEAVVERLRRLDRVLPDHRVDDEEHVLGGDRVLDVVELLHEGLVDREAARRIVDDDVVLRGAGLRQGLLADIERSGAGDVEDGDVNLRAEDLELLDGGGALHVGGDEKRLVPLLLQPSRELRAGRRLPGALEADHHDARRLALRSHDERRAFPGRHECDEFVVADLHEDVARRHLHRLPVLPLGPDANDLPECLLLDARKEGLHNAELDVGLEQRETHLAQRRVDVLLRQLRQPGQAVARRFEAFGERVEHG